MDSTDDRRSGDALRHAGSVQLDGPFELQGGGSLADVRVCYETWGTLNADRSNAVLVCHAISGDSHCASHRDIDPADPDGWWEELVGPGRPVDTDRWFVVCSNVLGGCRGTTGPGTINPATGKPYGRDFPVITVADMVNAQAALMDRLGIRRLRAVIGGSLGGHQALTWAVEHPDRLDLCVPIATSPRLSTQALAFDVVGRNAITSDPHYHDGQYYDTEHKPDVGLAIARMLGHITYLSPESMDQKFEPTRLQPRDVVTEFEKRFGVGSYLAHQGDRFTERFDANSYITLSLAMDLFDLGGDDAALRETLSRSACEWQVVSFSSDWLFTPEQSEKLVRALTRLGRQVSYCEVPTRAGHDGFLLPDEVSRFGRLIAAQLDPPREPTWQPDAPHAAGAANSPPKPKPAGRIDYDHIIDLIEPGASVLDCGCGRGGLLARLEYRGTPRERMVGIEVDETVIIQAVTRGFHVLDHDLNTGLSPFADRQFDVVVLSQTLPTISNVEGVIAEMVRVGRQAIVSFPNFGRRELRELLVQEGSLPAMVGFSGYEWYNTPNRRFPTVDDFEKFCEIKGLEIDDRVFLSGGERADTLASPQLDADVAIYVIRGH